MKEKQPPAIKEILFKEKKGLRSTRLYDDESKIKIYKDYRKGQCIYNLLDAWNNTDQDLRMAGNLFSLNRMIKDKCNNEIITCNDKKNCYTRKIDYYRNYQIYMEK